MTTTAEELLAAVGVSVTTAPHVQCPYCLGRFVPARSDAEWCSGACRTGAYRARMLPDYSHVDPASIRSESSCAARGAATGRAWMSRAEHERADYRIRVLAGESVEIRRQWEAADELPDIAARLGITPQEWAARYPGA